MTDQTIPADDLRRFIARYRAAVNDQGSILLDELDALLPAPPRPTLEGMLPEERHACRWIQADVDGITGRWLILNPYDEDGDVEVVLESGRKEYFSPDRVTPRPDLPRMEWPGNQKPAPALPEGWRLADHQEYGRVIVTTPEPDSGGKVAFVRKNDFWDRKYSGDWCKPDELTYIDTEPEADQ